MPFFRKALAATALRVHAWLPKGRLFRSTALLSGGTVLTQIAGVCMAPIYARLYAPFDYGVFGQFYSIVCTLLTVGCFCYELAIPTAKDDEEALTLVVLSVGCVGVITLASLVWAVTAVLGSGHSLAANPHVYFLLVPLGVLLSGLCRVAQYWAIRVQAFKAIAATSLKQMLGGQSINLGFGLLHPSPLGLVLGQVVSSSAGLGSLAHATKLGGLLKTHQRSVLRMHNLSRVAKKYSQYALIQCPSTLLNSLGTNLPGMLMLPYYGAPFAGQFNMAQRIGQIPVSLVGTSVSQVFFSEAASIARSEPRRLLPLFNSISRKLALLAVLSLVPCLLAPLFVPIVFGQRWHEAGALTMWLGFGLALQLAVSPLSNIPNVVGRLKGQLILDAIRAALVFAALYVPWRSGFGGAVAVACYAAVMVANYAACYALYHHQLRVHSQEVADQADLKREVLA